MKRIFKLFPVALAVFALASCSNDDLLGEKGSYATSEKGDLIVEVEPFDNVTRALRDADGGSLTFQAEDQFKVYDDQLYKYDIYEFNEDAFYRKGSKILETPKYGLFPGKQVVRGYYDRDDNLTKGEFAIPETIVYGPESEQKVGEKTLYAANLPMFGLATLNGEKVYVSKLRHICGVLKLNLGDVYGKANWLRLSSTKKKLSGTFVAVLDASSEEARKGVKLQESTIGDLITFDHIYIDLRNVPSRNSYIYIPIIPGINANADGLKLEYSSQDKDAGSKVTAWDDTGLKFPKEVIAQNKLYEASWQFNLTDMNPYKVSDMLDQYQETESSIVFDLADKFTIDAATPTVSNVIEIPALNKGVDVTINLGKKFGTAVGDGWINATPDRLEIVDADSDDPFTGTFTLNVSDILEAANVKQGSHILIKLPEANVKIIGDLSAFDGKNIILGAAKSVTFGDGKTVTKSNANWLLGTIEELTIAEKATLTSALAANSYSGSFPTPVNVILNVQGQVVGNLNFATLYNAELNVTSKLTNVDDIAIAGNVNFGGDVEIALANEAEAISGTLWMRGAKSELTIKQGYVNEIKVELENAGTWESKYINVNLDKELKKDDKGNPVYGKTSFLTLTEVADKGVAKFTKSVWCGQPITNATYKNKVTNAYGFSRNIFTACQLAMTTSTGSDYQLANNIDLNSKVWTGYEKNGDFSGIEVAEVGVDEDDYEYPTIENLNLTNGGGLFTTCTTAASVQDISISGVSAAPTDNKTIGSLYATAANTLDVTNVTVTGINIVGTAPTTGPNAGKIPALSNVGGIVGSTTATLTLNKVSTAGSITGYSCLGGFVGTAGANVIAGTATDGSTTCSSSVALAANYASGLSMDMNYARMGGFVGTIINNANVTIADKSAATNVSITGKPDVMYLSDKTAGDGNFYNYTQDQKYIGFSGTEKHLTGDYAKKFNTITILGKEYIEPTFGEANKIIGTPTKTIGVDDPYKNSAVLYHFTKK